MLTEETINKLVELFEDDQKEALEFKQGNRIMTLNKQLKYYFGNETPFTNDQDKFLDGFALNIQKNIGLICKISKLKEYSINLSNKKGFTKVTLGISDSQTNTKRKTLNNNSGIKEYLKYSNNYVGTTERSDDWSGIKDIYDLQFKKNLKSDLSIRFKNAVETIEAGKKQGEKEIIFEQSKDSINNNLLTSEDQAEIEKQIAQKISEARELPSWNNLVTTGDFSKSRDSERITREGTNISNSDLNVLNTSFTFADSENINRALEADIHDLRSTFWNSFYYLFINWPCL